MRRPAASLLVCLVVAVGPHAPRAVHASTIDVPETLEEDAVENVPLLRVRPIQWMRERWRQASGLLERRLSLRLGLSYTLISQRAVEIDGADDTTVGSMDLIGRWTLHDSERFGKTDLGFAFRRRDNWGALTGTELSDRIGLPWGINDSGSGSYTQLNQIWFAQTLLDETLIVTLGGRLDQTVYFNTNRVAGSGNKAFMMQSLVHSRSIAFPGQGTGMNVRWAPCSLFYATAGLGDAFGDPAQEPRRFGSIGQREFFEAAEVGISPDLGRWWPSLGEGTYRFTGWKTAETDTHPAGGGFALSFDQQVGDRLVPFLRYGTSPDDVFESSQEVSAGFGLLAPFGRKSDTAGIGFTWAIPVEGTGDQYAMEVFYGLELVDGLTVSPDLELLFAPAQSPDRDVVAVLGVRTRLAF